MVQFLRKGRSSKCEKIEYTEKKGRRIITKEKRDQEEVEKEKQKKNSKENIDKEEVEKENQ